MGFPPKSSILIGFSIFFTIHFWGIPLLLEENPSMWGNDSHLPSFQFFFPLVFIGNPRPIHRQDLMLMRLSGYQSASCSWPHPWWPYDKSVVDTVDGSEIRQTHQLRPVVFSFIYGVNYTSQVVVWDFWTINSMFWYRKQWKPFPKKVPTF